MLSERAYFVWPWFKPRHRDFTCGYTGLHWACKHGNIDMVKLLAGTYQVILSEDGCWLLNRFPFSGKHKRANTRRLHPAPHSGPTQPSRGFRLASWRLQGWCQCEGLCRQKAKAVHDGSGTEFFFVITSENSWCVSSRELRVWVLVWAMTPSEHWRIGNINKDLVFVSSFLYQEKAQNEQDGKES